MKVNWTKALASLIIMVVGLSGSLLIKQTAALELGEPTATSGEFEYFDEYLLKAGDKSSKVSGKYGTVADLVNIIIKYLFIAGGITFLALILFSGYKIAFMGDKQKALSDVKQYLTTGIIGLLVMFAAYWIVQIIELLTGTQIL